MQNSLPIKASLQEAWLKTYGAKKTFWAALGVVFLVFIGFGILREIAHHISPVLEMIIAFISQLFGFLFQMGLLYMGIQRANDLPIHYKQIFKTFQLAWAGRLIGLYILNILILILPALLIAFAAATVVEPILKVMLIVVGVLIMLYLVLRLFMAQALVLDQQMNPWPAVKLSFKLTQHHVLCLLALVCLQFLIFIVSIIPLGIGLIWTIPFLPILYGVIYRHLSQFKL